MGEIIQYKNYLAENIPPYPEDATVAKWVLNYAEPNGIVSIKDKIPVDNSNLKEFTEVVEEPKKVIIKKIMRKVKPKIKINKIELNPKTNKTNKTNEEIQS